MDNPLILAVLSHKIQDEDKQSTTQHIKLKRWAIRILPNTGDEPRYSRRDQFLHIIGLLPDYSYVQDVLDTTMHREAKIT